MKKHTISSVENYIMEQLFLELHSKITKTYLNDNWKYVILGIDNIYFTYDNPYERNKTSRKYPN